MNQTEKEKELGLEVTPYFLSLDQPKRFFQSEIGFVVNVVNPL